MVGTDLFEFESKPYLLTVDYYSKFIEVDRLQDMRSKATIKILKAQFSRRGIPEVIRSDRGLQFASKDFARFCKEYGIAHKTSRPHLPSANGEAERAVETVKRLWRKAADKQLALLDYRTTPLEGVNLSPAQLLMGRRLRNKLPSLRYLLTPTAYNHQDIMQRLNQQKANQKFYHDSKSASELPPLRPGSQVRMAPSPGSKMWNPAIVVKRHISPRSYIVESASMEPCDRSSNHQPEPATTSSAEISQSDEPYTSRSGRADGKRSAQFEQTLLVTETGCDILTIRPDDNGRPHFLSQM
ncbi:Uncharacterized protein K02A2.6 [Stylophora pistillata]|uniref:Uncharacterized protein K02A2.6 n=1 Tax=Stylophora pistillata TaxID=50429 RepID=A0A2B4SER5_STYPI|nr:Uncharacterized protein K02A2.6 [Stylophora pistillata]